MTKRILILTAITMAILLLPTQSTAATVVAYSWDEGGPGFGTNSIHQSRHGVQGPVIADDFQPWYSGWVTRVDWWGSAPLVGLDNFELTFHADAGGVPAATAPSGGISQHFVSSGGTDLDGDGVFHYSVSWAPQDLFLWTGTDYWFSAANAQGFGWYWADAGGPGPAVGTEQYTGVVSTGIGPNGGPHFGPWNPVFTANGTKQDLAFQITMEVVPEPTSLLLVGLGLCALGVSQRRRFRS